MRRNVIIGVIVACAVAVLLTGCSMIPGGGPSSQGIPFDPHYYPSAYDAQAAQSDGTNSIDFSHAAQGYIGAASTSPGKLKLQVQCGEQSYHYDLPSDSTPIVVPVNMGDGAYTARVMQNTSGNRYIELYSVSNDVVLDSEMEPYIRPNLICNYTDTSACAVLATELCAGAATEGEAFDAIFDYVRNNIDYDREKASRLEDVTGYIPNPDETLATRKGICFDYASLTAAMLRSQGIPCKILTGYVSPENIYHAWDMIYVDGSWTSLHISAVDDGWARADMTLAAAGADDTIGDGSSYSERYTY